MRLDAREARQLIEAEAHRLACADAFDRRLAAADSSPGLRSAAIIEEQLAPIPSVEALAESFARESGIPSSLTSPESPLRAGYALRFLALTSGARSVEDAAQEHR